jgi:hypothetical protein
MQLLKQSTASTVYVGPVLDSAGAAVTTAVVGDFRLVKNGTAATLSGATVTHDANGYYTVALTTTNTDTTGRLTLAVGNTVMSMSTHRFSVLLASVFDALITNATNATGGLPTATAAISALAGAISTLTAGGVRTELTTELGRLDATVSSRMASYTQPTGFLAATFPTTVASPTNITAATGVVLSGVTHTGAVIPTVSTVTNGVTVTTNNDKTGYTASTVSDKTGYSLLATTGLGNQTANITGNLSGSVGSVTGAVTVGTMNANVITASAIATDAATEIATAVWSTDLQTWPDDQAGSDLYEMLTTITTISGRMPTLHYGVAQAGGASTITLNASASSITDYYVGLAIAITASTGAGQVRTITAYNGTTKVATVDSAWTTNPANGSSFAIIQAAGTSGGGGGTDWTANERTAIRSILGFDSSGTVSLPTVGVMDAIKDKTDLITSSGISVVEDRVNLSTITMQYNESTTATVNLDENTTSATLQFVVSRPDGTDILTIANGSITRTSTSFTVTITTAVTATLGQYLWSLRDITGGTNRVVTKGVLTVQNAASV